MKKPLHRFLIVATALSASIAFAQNPPRPERPDGSERPPQRPFDADRRDEPRGPEGRDFQDGPPPRPDGERPMLRDRQKNGPAPLPQKPQPYLGVITRVLEPALSAQLGFTPGLGLSVEGIVPGGPAEKAGVQKMDVIKQINDQLVSNPGHLAALVRHFGKDTEVTVLVVRKGQEQKIAVKIGEHLQPDLAPFRPEIFGGTLEGGENMIEFKRRMENQRRGGGDDRNRFPRDPQDGPESRQPRPSADILREVGPGGAPEVQTRQDQVSTTWNTSGAKVSLKDQNGAIEVRSENGRRTLIAKNPKGDTVFDGPIDTEEQRKTVPAEFRKMLEQVEVRSRGDRRPVPAQQGGGDARASAGSFAPLPLEPGRFKPRQGEPEVQ